MTANGPQPSCVDRALTFELVLRVQNQEQDFPRKDRGQGLDRGKRGDSWGRPRLREGLLAKGGRGCQVGSEPTQSQWSLGVHWGDSRTSGPKLYLGMPSPTPTHGVRELVTREDQEEAEQGRDRGCETWLVSWVVSLTSDRRIFVGFYFDLTSLGPFRLRAGLRSR